MYKFFQNGKRDMYGKLGRLMITHPNFRTGRALKSNSIKMEAGKRKILEALEIAVVIVSFDPITSQSLAGRSCSLKPSSRSHGASHSFAVKMELLLPGNDEFLYGQSSPLRPRLNRSNPKEALFLFLQGARAVKEEEKGEQRLP